MKILTGVYEKLFYSNFQLAQVNVVRFFDEYDFEATTVFDGIGSFEPIRRWFWGGFYSAFHHDDRSTVFRDDPWFTNERWTFALRFLLSS